MFAGRYRWPVLALATTVAGLAGIFAAALLFAWSGLYSVAASTGHWAIVSAFLDFGMRRSVRTHAATIDVPPLDDTDLIELGAAHFHGNCANCHGAPGLDRGSLAAHMLPPPPNLSNAAKHWRASELFWIVKHGIKYTGMPSWVADERDDEVWSIVAFLRILHRLDPEQYRALAIGRTPSDAVDGREFALGNYNSPTGAACARCHGFDERGPTSAYVPTLHGQSQEYLSASLRAYASGDRNSGIMQPVAAELDDKTIAQLANYYSKLVVPKPKQSGQRASSKSIARGRRLAEEGVPENGIPPCTSCHGDSALPTYPRLDGQPAAYLAGQLRLWKRKKRGNTANAAVMAPIARRLTEEQIGDVTAYYAEGRRE